jgi:gliding motility-associated-like protein
VVTANGCTGQDIGCLYVYPDVFIYIPNTFTPNDDKMNDWFHVEGVGIAEITMEIFNRWGEPIYATNSMEGWPGTIGNSTIMAKQDVYVYKIRVLDAVGEFHDFYGHVNLIR